MSSRGSPSDETGKVREHEWLTKKETEKSGEKSEIESGENRDNRVNWNLP